MKKLLVLIAIVVLVLAGCQYVPSQGNSSNVTTADLNMTLIEINDSDMMSNMSEDEPEDTLDNETTEDSSDISEEDSEDVDSGDETNEEVADDTLNETSDVQSEDPTQNTDSSSEVQSTDAPIDSSLPTKTINEGELVEFKQDVAFDPDGDDLEYSFGAPLDENGVWQTEIGDAGNYIVSISVSDGELTSTIQANLIVKAINNKPVLSNLNDITVQEGDTIELSPQVNDADGDIVRVSYEGFMTSSTRETDFDDAGEYEVTIIASDGKQSVSKTISVTVENVNRLPVLSVETDVEVTEGELVSISAQATDADEDDVSITFGPPLDTNGSWQTEEGDSGVYEVDVTASDEENEITETITIEVLSLNAPPTISIDSEITVSEGETIVLEPSVADSDGDSIRITYEGFMTSSTRETDFDDAGEYEVTITVSDGTEEVSKTVNIIIENTNRAPEFNLEDLFE